MGILDRFRRHQRDRPAERDAPGLFTARSGAVPPELGGSPHDRTAADDDLWDRPAPGPGTAPPPGVPPGGGSTADQPLFGADEPAPAPVPPPASDPVPPMFDHPSVTAEPAPTELLDAPEAGTDPEGGRTMRVHDGRLDKRPGPIRMTPSEAIALAQDGPQALHRRTHPDTGPST